MQNHTPEVIVVDELGVKKEMIACQSIGERGVQLIATVHGITIEDVMNNHALAGGIGDIDTVIVGDREAKKRGRGGNVRKLVKERRGKPTFETIVEIRQRSLWVIHDVEASVDAILLGDSPLVQVID